MRTTLARILVLLCAAGTGLAQTTFSITFDKALRDTPATGRLVVYLMADKAGIQRGAEPADDFSSNPQPRYGIDVAGLAPGTAATVGEEATSFPCPLSKLPAGAYRVQAVLDMHHDNSEWRREEGNLYSEPQPIRLGETDGPTTVSIALTKAVKPRTFPKADGVEPIEVRSALLSDFHHRDVYLRAGIVLPTGYAGHPDRRYPAVYEVPGFGGDHFDAAGRGRARIPGSAGAKLAEQVFWIVLDPESGNGHTLFANSANNGPCADALVRELIPAIEAKYRLVPEPWARMLRGHSSGGWSTLWLALTQPETFGATWSTSPDPIDFRAMQIVDIYHDDNLYAGKDGDIPAMRRRGKDVLSNRQENTLEEVLGPGNTSGQQWDSWYAVWGPRDAAGHPAALIDPVTGAIDHAVAERYRAYDIGELLRKEPGRYGPIFQQRVRLLVGDQDSYFLNNAVALLKPDVDKLQFLTLPEGKRGYISILPGFDHGSIAMAPEFRNITQEMLDHIARHAPAVPAPPDTKP